MERATDHDLLCLGKVVGWVSVQLENSQLGQRSVFLGNDLGWVEQIEAESQRLILVHDLDGELPFRTVSRGNGVVEIRAVSISILASQVLRLLPDETGTSLLGLEVPLDQLGLAFVCNQTEGMNTMAVLLLVRIHVVICTVEYIDLPCVYMIEGYHSRPWPRTAYAECLAEMRRSPRRSRGPWRPAGFRCPASA